MLHHLVGGTWGLVIRRPLESGAMTLPLMALLFLPLAFGLPTLYPWARPNFVAEYLREFPASRKFSYLNINWFLVRTVGYFVIWTLFALLLNRWSAQQDRTQDEAP